MFNNFRMVEWPHFISYRLKLFAIITFRFFVSVIVKKKIDVFEAINFNFY